MEQQDKKVVLPTDAKARKAVPLCTGVLDYFPDALADVAHLSQVGNDQHNPGQPLHWSKHKSSDHGDCLLRHQVDRGTRDSDGVRHSTKVAWRALAQLQIEIEAERARVSVREYLAKLTQEAEAEKQKADARLPSAALEAMQGMRGYRPFAFGNGNPFEGRVLPYDTPGIMVVPPPGERK